MIRKFSKEERDSNKLIYFKYWFCHWYIINKMAIMLGKWRIKYIFHDMEKPWINLFFGSKICKKFHISHNRHHLDYILYNHNKDCDYEEMILDFESARFTKNDEPLGSRETIDWILKKDKYKKLNRFSIEKKMINAWKNLHLDKYQFIGIYRKKYNHNYLNKIILSEN